MTEQKGEGKRKDEGMRARGTKTGRQTNREKIGRDTKREKRRILPYYFPTGIAAPRYNVNVNLLSGAFTVS